MPATSDGKSAEHLVYYTSKHQMRAGFCARICRVAAVHLSATHSQRAPTVLSASGFFLKAKPSLKQIKLKV